MARLRGARATLQLRYIDVVIVHINSIVRRVVPTTASEILNCINEVGFNCSLVHELRNRSRHPADRGQQDRTQ
ncbi:hypothetical protein C2L64_13025 [Paraburkholderia hospita]|uniref:Uncharacterized protein n=2 Tax=Paraburkholderia hospita TaxID=169430 RepID=A0AAN1MJB7_9BURK|nr:hypothetical protein C2L64_13025 [Paraburkholderia hospita]